MSLENWDPDLEEVKTNYRVDKSVLEQFITISKKDLLDDLEKQLTNQFNTCDLDNHSALMTLNKEQWFSVAELYSDADLEHLMRFFTVAEKNSGWEAGANSPVIWLGKILKKRGTGINRELVLWIKAHSNNKFLPHGPLI